MKRFTKGQYIQNTETCVIVKIIDVHPKPRNTGSKEWYAIVNELTAVGTYLLAEHAHSPLYKPISIERVRLYRNLDKI